MLVMEILAYVVTLIMLSDGEISEGKLMLVDRARLKEIDEIEMENETILTRGLPF